jgi:signal transduction histidine kinase
MQPPLKLPIGAAVAILFTLSLVEPRLRPVTDPQSLIAAVHVVLFATLLVLPRAPITVVAALLLEIVVIRHFGILDMIGLAGGLLTVFVASFAAAALVPTRRLVLLVAVLAAHFAWRASALGSSLLVLYSDAALFGVAIVTGAVLQRRHRRLHEIRAERDRLVAALHTGPGDAATAEQMRTWSLLKQRIEPTILALPGLVERAREAEDRAEAIEAVRTRAAGALAEMQATLHALGDPPPPPPEPPHLPRSRMLPPLWIACALLLIAAVIEMLVAGRVTYFAPVLALLVLLTPRAPVTTAAALGIAAILCSLNGEIPVAARVADFSAITVIVVAATTATPRRATATFVLVTTGLLVSQALDPTQDWPAAAFIGTTFVYLGHWVFSLLLRDTVAEQQEVKAGLEEIADALARLEARAARTERVRLARELHDLVGHALTAVAIQAGVAQTRLKRGLEVDFAPLAAAARQGSTELARLATVLGHDTDIAAEFTRITDTARATGQHVELALDEPAADVDPHVRHAVVCVAAEALTNAAKHAAGATVRVELKASQDRLELAVLDDGGGRHELPSGGRGLDSMAQRVRACGGTFASGPRPGGGWRVQAVVPLSA